MKPPATAIYGRGSLMVIQLKRAYEPPESDDGFRVLVDRLWPRGVSKSAARIDLWLKEIAPSAVLRQWFGHDLAKWNMGGVSNVDIDGNNTS
jgi:uncharacterized protein YeaO (DUF488 family)